MTFREFWSEDRRLGVRIPADVLKVINNLTDQSHPTETGGILIGRYSKDKRLALITQASTPPRGSRASRWLFVRSAGCINRFLRSLWNMPERRYYIGEWHYHPARNIVPSHQDQRQMRDIASTDSYQCTEPIMLIIGMPPDPRPIHAEVATSTGERFILFERPENKRCDET